MKVHFEGWSKKFDEWKRTRAREVRRVECGQTVYEALALARYGHTRGLNKKTGKYTLEAIIDKRCYKRSVVYCCVWKGWSTDESTWEKKDDIPENHFLAYEVKTAKTKAQWREKLSRREKYLLAQLKGPLKTASRAMEAAGKSAATNQRRNSVNGQVGTVARDPSQVRAGGLDLDAERRERPLLMGPNVRNGLIVELGSSSGNDEADTDEDKRKRKKACLEQML